MSRSNNRSQKKRFEVFPSKDSLLKPNDPNLTGPPIRYGGIGGFHSHTRAARFQLNNITRFEFH